MTPIVDPSWPRMGSDMEHPFQNVPGRFFYALPDVRAPLFTSSSTSRVSSSSVPSTPSLPRSPLEGQAISLLCDESGYDQDGCLDTTQGESEPKVEEGEAYSELDAKSRSDSHTRTPSPSSSTSSEQDSTSEKTKRSRRRRRRNRKVVDIGGCVMGPRMVHLPLYVSSWGQNCTSGIVPQSPWNPGYPALTVPGRDRWFEPQTVY